MLPWLLQQGAGTVHTTGGTCRMGRDDVQAHTRMGTAWPLAWGLCMCLVPEHPAPPRGQHETPEGQEDCRCPRRGHMAAGE